MKQGLDTINQGGIAAVAKQLGVKSEEVIEIKTHFHGRDISLEPLSEEDDESC